MYRRILVPLDGSATADRGFAEALALAKALGSTLVLLNVVEYTSPGSESAPQRAWDALWQGERERAQALLERAHRAASEAGIDCEARIEDTAAAGVAAAIDAQALRLRCDLVVMGTHGRSGLARALFGSDAEAVARHSPVPVLLVRENTGRRTA